MVKAAKIGSSDAARSYEQASTGVSVLDELINGGLPVGEMYVLDGIPGTGKTILAMHFLAAGVAAGEAVLCLTLSQRVESVKHTAASAGIDTRDIEFRDLSSVQDLQSLAQQQTIFDNSEIELEDTMAAFTQAIEEVQPNRVVFDGMSHLRMLADDPLIYRQQLFALRDYLTQRDITAVFTSTTRPDENDHELVAIAHGAITLTLQTTAQGIDWRTLHITKIRGSNYRSGRHDMEISDEGVHVYPAYAGIESQPNSASPNSEAFSAEIVTSGISALDSLLGGGLQMATSCLLVGPSGTGKSSLCALFAHSCAHQQGKVSIFLFDERIGTFLQRSQAFDLDLVPLIDSDTVRLHEMYFGNITPSKFVDKVIQEVEVWGAKMVVIDTLSGYFNTMPQQERLISRMHELMMALSRRGILSVLSISQDARGKCVYSSADISYLSDLVLLLHRFEAQGALRQAISVRKKRYGTHEKRLREIDFQLGGITLGPPLSQFVDILTDSPKYTGTAEALLPRADESND